MKISLNTVIPNPMLKSRFSTRVSATPPSWRHRHLRLRMSVRIRADWNWIFPKYSTSWFPQLKTTMIVLKLRVLPRTTEKAGHKKDSQNSKTPCSSPNSLMSAQFKIKKWQSRQKKWIRQNWFTMIKRTLRLRSKLPNRKQAGKLKFRQ